MKVPYCEATEAAVIGACVTWPERVLDAVLAAGLEVEDFFVPKFRAAWAAILEVVLADLPVDVHTVCAAIDYPEPERVLADAISEAAQSMPSHAPVWALAVKNYARSRSMLPGLLDAVKAAEAGKADTAATFARAALGVEEVTR